MVGFFVYKEWPGFWNRVKGKVQQEQAPDNLASRLERIEATLTEVEAKQRRDYDRINAMEISLKKDQHVIKEIKTEQGIIMRALLAALSGLQELGANGTTETAREEIIAYLNDQAHDGGE